MEGNYFYPPPFSTPITRLMVFCMFHCRDFSLVFTRIGIAQGEGSPLSILCRSDYRMEATGCTYSLPQKENRR